MRVAIVGTYPPARCGIATFTADVEAALRAAGAKVTVLPVVSETYEPVGWQVTRDDIGSYVATADHLETIGCDIVLIEHEFGIFGGDAGSHVLALCRELTVPYAVTLHTVLPCFAVPEWTVLTELCERASAVTVFTGSARQLLVAQGVADDRRLQVVPHGAPAELYASVDVGAVRRRLGLPVDAPVLSTFGLLSEGKGIETAIRALADTVDDHPDIRYVVAGRTHPAVVRSEGERYRERLKGLVQELDLEEHVAFINDFLAIGDIAELLAATDVFCTPYGGEHQAVSGALTFALAAGCPVVSTPYRYAIDMLSDGAGYLASPHTPGAFATGIRQLLADGPRRDQALHAAGAISRSLAWTTVGRTTLDVLERARRPKLTTGMTLGSATVAANVMFAEG